MAQESPLRELMAAQRFASFQRTVPPASEGASVAAKLAWRKLAKAACEMGPRARVLPTSQRAAAEA